MTAFLIDIDKQTLKIGDKRLKFDFLISHLVYLKDVFYILFDPFSDKSEAGQFPNLCGVNNEGRVIWKTSLPNTQADCYLNIYLKNNKLHAYSFSSYDCIIDFLTGKVTHSELCK